VKRAGWIAVGAAAAMVVAGYGGYVGWQRWTHRCGASFEAVDQTAISGMTIAAPGDADLGDLDKYARPPAEKAVREARDLPAPFGRLRRVTVLRGSARDNVRPIGAVGGDLLLSVGAPVLPGTSVSGAVARVDGDTGRVRWAREFGGYGAGGGRIGDQLVAAQIPNDRAPQVAALSIADGALRWCASLGQDVETGWDPAFDVDAIGKSAVAVARPSDASGESDKDVRLSRVDLADGEVGFDVRLRGVEQAHTVTSFGRQVIVTPLDADGGPSDLLAWGDAYRTGRVSHDPGMIHAYSARDGHRLWSYGKPGDGWVHTAIGASGKVAVVVSRKSTLTSDRPTTSSRLVGLRGDGGVAWRAELPAGSLAYFVDREVWVAGDQVLTNEPGGMVVSRDIATGRTSWREHLGRVSFSRPTRVGGRALLHREEGGMITLDLATGAATTAFPYQRFAGAVVDEETVTVQLGPSLMLTFDRQDRGTT
jgi:hypothetical protein